MPALHHRQADAAGVHERRAAADRDRARPQDDWPRRAAVDRRRRERDDHRRHHQECRRRTGGESSRSEGLVSEGRAARTDQASSDQLLGAAGLSVERMPMLHVIFDQMTNLCAEGLRSMSPSQSYFSLSSVGSSRLSDILERYESESIAAVFYAQAWDGRVMIGFDRDFVYTMVELLFGADGAEPPLDMPRVFSNVEMHVAEALFEQFSKA